MVAKHHIYHKQPFILFECTSVYLVLQQAGRNPSQATLNKYWTPRTTKLNFDDFCEILKSEEPTKENELLRAFKKMDVNGDGCISHKELFDALTSVRLSFDSAQGANQHPVIIFFFCGRHRALCDCPECDLRSLCSREERR